MPRQKLVTRRFVRLALFILLLSLLGYVLLAVTARPQADHPFFATAPEVMVIAHQGGDGLWPSNTRYAFEKAAELGVDVLEMDIHASKDGALVVIHDDTVDRTTDGSGAVKEMTLAELKKLDAGYDWSPERQEEHFPYRSQGIEIPTLKEVLEQFPHMPLVIEIKPDDSRVALTLCDLLQSYGRTASVLVASFHSSPLKAFRKACPQVATAATSGEVRRLFILSALRLGTLYHPQAQALQIPEYYGDLHLVTERLVKAAHAKKVDVHVWTVNDKQTMSRLIALGVDGIITDRPDRLLELLER